MLLFWVIFKNLHFCIKHTCTFGTNWCLLEVKWTLHFFLINQFPKLIILVPFFKKNMILLILEMGEEERETWMCERKIHQWPFGAWKDAQPTESHLPGLFRVLINEPLKWQLIFTWIFKFKRFCIFCKDNLIFQTTNVENRSINKNRILRKWDWKLYTFP